MSLVGSGQIGLWSLRASVDAIVARAKLIVFDGTDHSIAQRVAGAAFLIRIASAAIIFVSQIVLARWMGRFEFGIYVYVWTWVLIVGGLVPLGLAQSAQRFIPEYAKRGALDRVRGFLSGSRWLSFGLGTAGAAIGLLLILLFGEAVGSVYVIPLLLACACLPIYAVSDVQDGIARNYNWIGIALVPGYIARPVIVLAAMAAVYLAGAPATATAAIIAAVFATWATGLAQLLVLEWRLAKEVESGPRVHEVGAWLKISLPIVLVEGFYFLLTYTDLLVLEVFVAPDQLAVYYAATKTLALVAFVHFSVAAATAHRFSEYHATGAREKLEDFLALAVRWTFWPSLAATVGLLAVGKFLLGLFGEGFEEGYGLMFVLATGLIARAAIGPAERLLNMLGEQNICAAVYAIAFGINLVLCILLIPHYQLYGAAAAIAVALVVESLLLFILTKRRLGLHVFVWGR